MTFLSAYNKCYFLKKRQDIDSWFKFCRVNRTTQAQRIEEGSQQDVYHDYLGTICILNMACVLSLKKKLNNNYFGEGNGTPLQYSCLENPMEGGAWKAAVHGIAEGRTRLSDFTTLFTFMHWRRKWQPTPVFLPGESQGRGSLVGCRLWGHTESDTTEAT